MDDTTGSEDRLIEQAEDGLLDSGGWFRNVFD